MAAILFLKKERRRRTESFPFLSTCGTGFLGKARALLATSLIFPTFLERNLGSRSTGKRVLGMLGRLKREDCNDIPVVEVDIPEPLSLQPSSGLLLSSADMHSTRALLLCFLGFLGLALS